MSENDSLENLLVETRKAREKATWAKSYKDMNGEERLALFVESSRLICKHTCRNTPTQVKHLHQSI